MVPGDAIETMASVDALANLLRDMAGGLGGEKHSWGIDFKYNSIAPNVAESKRASSPESKLSIYTLRACPDLLCNYRTEKFHIVRTFPDVTFAALVEYIGDLFFRRSFAGYRYGDHDMGVSRLKTHRLQHIAIAQIAF